MNNENKKLNYFEFKKDIISEEVEQLLNIDCMYWNPMKKQLLMTIIEKSKSFCNGQNIYVKYDEKEDNSFFNTGDLSITINKPTIIGLIHELTHFFHYINSAEENRKHDNFDYPNIFRDLNKIIMYDKFTISKLAILLHNIRTENRPMLQYLLEDINHNSSYGIKDNDKRIYCETLLAIEGMVDSILFGTTFDEGISVQFSKNFDQNYIREGGVGHSKEYFSCSNASSTFGNPSIYDNKDKGLIFAELLACYSSVLFIDSNNKFLKELEKILGKKIFDTLDNYLYKIYHLEEVILEKNKTSDNNSPFNKK